MTKGSLLALALLALAGCSTVDLSALEKDDPDLAKLHADLDGAARKYSIYVAPVAVIASEDPAAGDELADRAPMLVNRERFPAEIQRCLQGVFGRVVASKETIERRDDAAAKLAEAARIAHDVEKCDLILYPRIVKHDAVFVDKRGVWWLDALFLAWYFYFPTWAIADEVYGVHVELEYTVASPRNDRPLPGLEGVKVTVNSLEVDATTDGEVPRGPRIRMDDLDRGVSVLRDMFEIFFTPGKLHRDQWSASVQPALEPYGRRAAALKLARSVVSGVKTLERNPEAMAATYAVVAGVGDYGQAAKCPFADRDARAFAAWLTGEAVAGDPLLAAAPPRRTPRKLVRELVDDQATVERVLEELEKAVASSRPEDTVVFYFAGRGVCADPTTPSGLGLALARAARRPAIGSREVLSLERLAKALDGGPEHARERVVILDTTFGAGLRGGDFEGTIDAAKLEAVVAPLAGKEGVLLLASGTRDAANVLEPAQHGLLTYALLDGACGAADADRSGLTWTKLRRHVERTVGALSRLEAETEQRPVTVLRSSSPKVLGQK